MGKPRAVNQAGILEGGDPSRFDPKNPIVLFIIQAGIIIIFTRLLHYPLSKIRQPRVIAEVVGGILLGPSVFGHVPGFTSHIFPTASMPVLTMAANLGLVFFLFLIGLEVDLRLLVSNWRVALSVGLAGMVIPFGLGLAIAYGLFHQFREDPGLVPISFGTYILFIGVAMAITAFPVLCRILSELNLLQTQVGVVVLSAGVGNDVVGWILLALCVALVNAGSGITALWVLLVCVGYTLLLVYGVRPVFLWILRRTGSLQNGPPQSVLCLTVLMVLASAFFTSIIGVHPIFGAFLVGLICPHDGGFAIKVAEKIEDLVAVLLLPLYFALSGLSTNLGLLDNGITWAYVVGVIAVAFFGKMIGGTVAARLNKLVWRESFTIGALMSCKGLVELIVLNIGYQAKILSQRTFTIFVVMALVTTFITTPLVTWLFPPWYQKKLAAWKRGEIDWDGNSLVQEDSPPEDYLAHQRKESTNDLQKVLVCLGLESLPSLFTFVSLLGHEQSSTLAPKVHPSQKELNDKSLTQIILSQTTKLDIYGLRLLELTERLSSVMQESEIEEWSAADPVVNAFHTFGQLNNVPVSGEVQFIAEGSYADVITDRAIQHSSDLILLPWSKSGSVSEVTGLASPDLNYQSAFRNGSYNSRISQFLDTVPCNTAILINNGFGGATTDSSALLRRMSTSKSNRSLSRARPRLPVMDVSHHIFVPVYGGPDDRIALEFTLRLAKNPNVTATVVLVEPQHDLAGSAQSSTVIDLKNNAAETGAFMYDITEQEKAFFHSAKDSLVEDMRSRIVFETIHTSSPLEDVTARAIHETGLNPRNAGNLVIIGRNHGSGKKAENRSDCRYALGECAEAVIASEVKASVLVIQGMISKRRNTMS